MKRDSYKGKAAARNRKNSTELGRIQDELDDLQSMLAAPADEPPMMLDQAVKNLARRELEKTPPVKKNPMFWVTGLSTASIALIALGISLVQNPSSTDPADEMPYRQKSEMEAPKEDARKRNSSRMVVAPASIAAEVMESDLAAPVVESSLDKMAADGEWHDSSVASDSALVDVNRDTSLKTQANESLLDAEPNATVWLERIRQLYSDGLLEEAQHQLAGFESAYPEYSLPDWAKEIQPPQD